MHKIMSFSLRKTQPKEFENLYMLLEMQQPQRNFYTEILNKEVFDISPPHHLGTDKQDVVARLNAENGQLRAAQNDKCNPTERCSPKRKQQLLKYRKTADEYNIAWEH